MLKICQQCQKEFEPKRSDAKFCCSTCKAKYWEQNKLKAEPHKSITAELRGTIDLSEKTENKSAGTLNPGTKTIQVETDEYKAVKREINELETSKKRLEGEIRLINQQMSGTGGSGGLLIVSGGALGAYMADSEFKSPVKNILGAFGGILGAAVINSWTAGDDEKNNQIRISNLKKQLNESNVSLTSVERELVQLMWKSLKVIQYEEQTVPAFRGWGIKLGESQTKIEPDLLQPKIKIPAPHTEMKNPVNSGKIISSSDLQKINHKALEFKDKWCEFFGYPSINFNCVIHGMSGEGKSTFAIQFANYLAENFGRVVYISGEEGFSKTFRDKFSNNNAVSDDLFVADLRTFEDVIKEIRTNTFNFIFIDSLDNMKIDVNKMKELRERYKDSAIITISQSTKEGKIRGSYEIVHDCDIAVKVENGVATTIKNRFKEKGIELRVFSTL